MPEAADAPSVILHGFAGGIVNSADLALRLAQVILDGAQRSDKPTTRTSLQVQDRGSSWSVRSVDGNGADVYEIDIRKRDAAICDRNFQQPLDVLGDMAVAEKFAAVLARASAGAADFNWQLPLTVIDRGDAWLVRGSDNPRPAPEGLGPFHLGVRKRDAKVLDMFFEGIIDPE